MKFSAFHKTNQTSGFTLIEVLVVVIIAGILAGIAAPGWLAFLNRQRVSTVKSELIQTLKNAQQDAIQKRLSHDSKTPAKGIKIEDSATVPTVVINGLTQTLGSDASRAGNLRLTSYVVTGGTKDTTFDTIQFDYQGRPMVGKSATPASFSTTSLPFVISVSAENSGVKQCVIVANLLGSIKTARDGACDAPNLAAQ